MIRELLLSPGKNRVAFEALHTSGTTEIETVTVFCDAPKEQDKPKDVEFSRSRHSGSSPA